MLVVNSNCSLAFYVLGANDVFKRPRYQKYMYVLFFLPFLLLSQEIQEDLATQGDQDLLWVPVIYNTEMSWWEKDKMI